MISGKLAKTVLILFQFFRHVQHETALVFNEHAESYLTAGNFLPVHIMQQVVFYQCILFSRCFSTSAYYAASNLSNVAYNAAGNLSTSAYYAASNLSNIAYYAAGNLSTIGYYAASNFSSSSYYAAGAFLPVHIMQQVLF